MDSRRGSDPGTHWTVDDAEDLALRIRLRAVRMVAPQGFGYLGQALSVAEQVWYPQGNRRKENEWHRTT